METEQGDGGKPRVPHGEEPGKEEEELQAGEETGMWGPQKEGWRQDSRAPAVTPAAAQRSGKMPPPSITRDLGDAGCVQAEEVRRAGGTSGTVQLLP